LPAEEDVADDYAELLTVLLYTAVLTPTFLFLVKIQPALAAAYTALWAASLIPDWYTTWRFYIEAPEDFSRNERNPIVSQLVSKLGFKRAAAAYTLIYEPITALLLAATLLPFISTFLTGETSINMAENIPTVLAVYGIGHIHASIRNFRINRRCSGTFGGLWLRSPSADHAKPSTTMI